MSFGEALRVWGYVALFSFGGPAGQIAVMHRVLVDEKRWVSESRFLHALNYCMLLPGPEAMQLITYMGWLTHRTLGGLIAGLLFILPGFVSILALSFVYALYGETDVVSGVFFGLQAAVLAIVAHAVVRIGSKVLKNWAMLAVAAGAFVAIFFFGVPFPLVVLGAGLVGLIGGRARPDLFCVIRAHGDGEGVDELSNLHSPRVSIWRTLGVAAGWLVVWWAPIVALIALLGPGHVLSREAVFFSKAAVVTFGGAYSVLAYIAQQAVDVYGWLAPGEMLVGLSMAETTPGPLIQVVQFVGFMGALRDPEPFGALVAATLGASVTTWVTFAPCFLWIFVGAPYIEKLRGNTALTAALSTITAAVVGVILNLALWFALHACFGEVEERRFGALRVLVPEWATVDIAAVAMTVGAFVAMFRFKVGMVWTLLACALVGLVVWMAR